MSDLASQSRMESKVSANNSRVRWRGKRTPRELAQYTAVAATFIAAVHILTLLGILWRLRDETGSMTSWITAGAIELALAAAIAGLGWTAWKRKTPQIAGVVLAWTILELLWKFALATGGHQPGGGILGLHGAALVMAFQGLRGARRLQQDGALQVEVFD